MIDKAKLIIREVDRDEAFEAHALAFPDDKWCGDQNRFWLARRGAKVAGFIALTMDDRGLYISRIAVTKCEQGIGKRLVRYAIRKGRQHGHRHAFTYTILKNYRSMCMLLRCGFKFVEPPKEGQYYGPSVHYFARAI